ncbi:hypothetical protein ACIBEJ_28410 [Nonomuraea sp. NPDC050790]|uniref:hypothetical protein n=1 Tax=Nonomuraea sp. NPDC050790 TaxID=3364371 RepID=UPI0037ADCCB2
MKRLLAVVLSLIVHALTLAFIVAGGALIVLNHTELPAWLAGGLLLAVGVMLRPKLGRLPADAEVLSRSAAPELYRAATRVAESLAVKPPAVVAIMDLGVDATYTRIGLRRTPVLVIGLPLWLALTPRQRVTLLARACAGGVIGEGLVVGEALSTLADWRMGLVGAGPLKPREEARVVMDRASLGVMHTPGASYEAAGLLGRIFGRVLGGPVLLAEYALTRLVRAGDSRTRERRRAMTARGTSAEELDELESLMASGRYLAPIQAAALRGESVPAIRQDALTRARISDDGVLTSAPGSELMGARESELIDAELLKHYTRAIRGFGLIS